MTPPSSSTPLFRVGDRVQLIFPQAGIVVGTTGTIVTRFLGSTLYDVQFDGYPTLQVVEGWKLAPVPLESSP
jgi:hypothetical protein